jgi:hypothetical protein
VALNCPFSFLLNPTYLCTYKYGSRLTSSVNNESEGQGWSQGEVVNLFFTSKAKPGIPLSMELGGAA